MATVSAIAWHARLENAKPKTNPLNTLFTEDYSEQCITERRREAGRHFGEGKLCFHSNVWSATSLSALHASSRSRKPPTSKPGLQYQPTCSCTCCRPMCRSCCGTRLTTKSHLMIYLVAPSSAKRSAMASQLLLLLRLT